ncbi:MAG: site-specific DNA-methyltransferase [Desulfobulbaceae bacterium]|jgi:adenine-specific DNA-methyltransferase
MDGYDIYRKIFWKLPLRETLLTSKYDRYSKDELIKIIEDRDRKPKLGLVWERDDIECDRSFNQDFVALDLDAELSCGSGPWTNLLIEGDNFDALRYLRMTHAGRVKCICIDPPYNTGNRDFIYNDRFVDKDDRYKHSKWLEFLFRRFLLVRELLAEDGVLLVCINDENRARLELLLDQALPGMRIGSFVWRSRTGGNDTGGAFLSSNHEHVLVYGGKKFRFSGDEKSYSMYRFQEGNRLFRLSDLTSPKDLNERPNTYYPIHDPATGIWYPCNPDRVWAYASKERLKPGQKTRGKAMEELIAENIIWFPPNQRVETYPTMEALLAAIDAADVPKSGTTLLLRRDLPELETWVGKKVGFGRPAYKRYKETLKNETQPISSWLTPKFEVDTRNAKSNMPVVGTTEEGSKLIKDIMGSKAFSYPKPLSLIRSLIEQATEGNDLVMDFFAGSGTTAQAALELNREDGGNRRFILVSATEATSEEPEKNICRDVCAERLRRVINGYGKSDGTGGDFAYLRARRIPDEAILSEIDHAQVWTLLQLIHGPDLAPYEPARMPQESPAGLVYATTIDEDIVQRIAALAAGSSHLTVYTWQPGLLRERLPGQNLSIEQIPHALLSRFGSAS